jgi:hypothetical protein
MQYGERTYSDSSSDFFDYSSGSDDSVSGFEEVDSAERDDEATEEIGGILPYLYEPEAEPLEEGDHQPAAIPMEEDPIDYSVVENWSAFLI